MERTVRHRVKIATSTKGVITWDATVEMTSVMEEIGEVSTAFERALVLSLSDKLVAELESRYPIEKEK